MNIYELLTKEFNQGRLRAVLSSGQAVVLHRIAIMSKDGDWIIREDEECTEHILRALEEKGAVYRFGAPLDVRWLSGGWSSHFEYYSGGFRIRCDFVTKPPRIDRGQLNALWDEAEGMEVPYVGLTNLSEIKKTDREKDYAVIGELARRMSSIEDQLMYSRSARDIMRMAESHPEVFQKVAEERPVLKEVFKGREQLEIVLDAERRNMMHVNEERINQYMGAAREWRKKWIELSEMIIDMPLKKAHDIITGEAERILPKEVTGYD